MRRDRQAQPPPRWLNTPQAAEYVHLSPHTLERMRRRGDGPRFRYSGRKKVVYDVQDLDAWIESGVDHDPSATSCGE